MNRLFDIDGGLWSALNKIANLFILNILFILFCIPIITAGASITALHYVTQKMARGRETYVTKDFFRSFKENFKQATQIWLGFLALALLLYIDLRFITSGLIPTMIKHVFQILLGIILLIYILTYTYIFPVLSKFVNPIRSNLKNSIIMAVRHFPFTVLILIFSLIPAVCLILVPKFGIPFVTLFGISFSALLCSYVFNYIFKKYIPEEYADDKIQL